MSRILSQCIKELAQFRRDRLHVVLDRPDTEIPYLQAVLATANIEVRSIRVVRFSLEDAFISVVQRTGTGGHMAE